MQRQLDEDKNDEHFMDQMQNECKYKAYDKNVFNSLKHKDYMCYASYKNTHLLTRMVCINKR